MSFEARNFAIVSTGAYDTESPQVFSYKSADDTLATIKGSGYFNNARPLPNFKDFIIIYGSDTTDIVSVTAITPNVTVVSAITNPSLSLTDGDIYVGDASNIATARTMSGDATISNTGVLTIGNNAVTTAKVNDNAITTAKINNQAVTGPKTVMNKFYSSVTVLTTGTTPVSIFGGVAPANLTLTHLTCCMVDATAATIILKNAGVNVATVVKVATLAAYRGATSMANTAVTAGASVTVESNTTGNVFAIVTYTVP